MQQAIDEQEQQEYLEWYEQLKEREWQARLNAQPADADHEWAAQSKQGEL